MIRELFTNNNNNFYEGEHDGGDFNFFESTDFNRKEIFTKKSRQSRLVNKDNSEILGYLFLSDFKHIYYNTTIIGGLDCICLILDENLISEILYSQDSYRKWKKILGLKIDDYPLLPNTRQRLLCTIRIDKHSNKKNNQDIYIYSYQGKILESIDQGGLFNFGQSLNIISLCTDYKRVTHNFIIFPEGNYGIIKVFHFAKIKISCSRLEDFYNQLISDYTCPIENIYGRWDGPPFDNYKRYEEQDKSDILNVLFLLLNKNDLLKHLYLYIALIDGEIIIHFFFDDTLIRAELIGFPIIITNSNSFAKKIILLSIRQKYTQLIYFSYFGYFSKLIDDNHNLSNVSDSFTLAFHNGKYIRSDMWNGKSYADRDWFIIFYDDDSKNLYQLPVGEIEKIPKYNNVSIEKKGSFYYTFKGHSVKPYRRLMDLLEHFYFEYDFRHKEIFRHIVIKSYDDKK